VFARATLNNGHGGGLELVGKQAIGVGAAAAWAAVVTFVLLKAIGLVTSLRARAEEEGIGLDVTQHGEEAYSRGEGAILILPEGGR